MKNPRKIKRPYYHFLDVQLNASTAEITEAFEKKMSLLENAGKIKVIVKCL